MRVVSTQILSGVTSGSINGAVALDTNQAVNVTFQTVSNSPDAAGTVKIQGSNDNPDGQDRKIFVPTNWSDIPNATAAVTSGAAPMIVLSNVACQYMRAVYTRSGGGAADKTITVQANAIGG